MKLNRNHLLALLTVFVLVGGAAALAGGGTWVSRDDDQLHDIHGDVAFFPDGATELNVADLADGETRIVGEGAKQVTVSREGDAITIRRSNPAEGADMIDIVCQAGKDSCKILTIDEEPEQVVVVIQKTRTCINGEGDCDLDLHTISGEHGNQFVIKKRIECAEGEKCREFTSNIDHVMPHGSGSGTMVIETLGDHGIAADNVMVLSADGAGNVIFLGDDKVTLRCPEGDTTMHVEQDEAEEVFLCPKHSQALEKHDMRRMLHRIKRHDHK